MSLPTYVPAVWDLKDTSQSLVLLWRLSKDKNLTRVNLAMRQHPKSPLLFDEIESNQHLFFECVVAIRMWGVVSQII